MLQLVGLACGIFVCTSKPKQNQNRSIYSLFLVPVFSFLPVTCSGCADLACSFWHTAEALSHFYQTSPVQ